MPSTSSTLTTDQPGTGVAPLRRCVMAAVVGWLCCGVVAAAPLADSAPYDPQGLAWTFGGFGTVGVVHSSEKQADFVLGVLQPNGAGHTRDWSADVDSRLGAQLGLTVNRQWSAVVQVVSERKLDNSYRPVFEWANIKYQATPELSVRVGRIALPVFLAADYRKVGYATPWVRAPLEMYGSIPVSNSDGIDASYRWNGAGFSNTTQVLFGRSQVKVPGNTPARARQLAGITNTLDAGALSLRASLLSTELTVDLTRPLFDLYRTLGPQGVALADTYDADHKRTSAVALGFNYDPGPWFVTAEVSRVKTRSYLGDNLSAYASAGYRLGDFTPFVVVGGGKSLDANDVRGVPLQGPAQTQALAGVLNNVLDAVLDTIVIQRSASLGLRWEVAPDVALTAQYDRLQPLGGSNGTLRNVQPGFRSGGTVHVASFALDFVF